MANCPTVSVLMPVYNAAPYLAEAIESILSQTFGDFEFLIIDDGSADDTAQIAESYAQRDQRIRLVRHAENQGQTARLNQGLALARGRYIARMDGDDISLSERLGQQVAFFDSHPGIGVCGSWLPTIGDRHTRFERYPTSDADIRCQLLFRDVLAHPAVMLRRALFTEHGLAYDPFFQIAQDYDLWARCAEHTQLANMPQVLLHYRVHQQQMGQRRYVAQYQEAAIVRLALLDKLGLEPSPDEQALHAAISTTSFTPSYSFINAAESWLLKIRAANRQAKRYAAPALAETLGLYWYAVCRRSTGLGPGVWLRFQRSRLRHGSALGWPRIGKLALKSLVRAPSL